MVNVLDFKCDHYPEDLLLDIFNHQHNLAKKYIPIEKSNGLCLYDKIPADIDNAKAQARIKDMTWRAVEELAEAIEALINGEFIHFYEELADALHFLVEKYLLCDFIPTNYPSYERIFQSRSLSTNLDSWFRANISNVLKDESIDNIPILNQYLAEFVVASGLTCNCLKNKPWKQSQVITDEARFRRLLRNEFEAFINLCKAAGYTDKKLYDMYIRKNQVNQFRQKSNY